MNGQSDIKVLAERIKGHEGYSNEVYRDTLGNLTVGYGHLLSEGSVVPDHVCHLLFDYDLAMAISDFMRLPKSTIDHLNKARRSVIVEMIFNMGLPKVLQFVKMWEAIKSNDFNKAADEMLDSNWARQVKSRALVLANIMRSGE